MGGVRPCVLFLVLFVNLRIIAGAPIFEFLWCDLFCDDDDITSTTTSSTEDFFDMFFDCRDCRFTGRRPSTTTQPSLSTTPVPFNLMIRPGTNGGVDISLGESGQFLLNIAGAPAATTPGPATTPPTTAATTATTAAGATTAAAATTAATTAAPAARK